MKKYKTKNDLKVYLTYNPSPEASLRIFRALSMLINEEDILNHSQKLLKKNAKRDNQKFEKMLSIRKMSDSCLPNRS